jgi:hypothetical protein
MSFDISIGITRTKVMVGESEFMVATPTLHQVGALAKVVSELRVERIRSVIEAFANEHNMLVALSQKGVLENVQALLGQEFIPTMQRLALTILDTRANARIISALIQGDISKDEAADGTYLGCPQLRTYINENLTLTQALAVIYAAWNGSGLAEAMGKLMGSQTPQNSPESSSTT